MLLPIKAICNPRKQRKDGTCVVYIQFCYTSQSRTLLDTGIAIPPVYWNSKKRCISDKLAANIGNAKTLNQRLHRAMRIVEDIISYALGRADLDPAKF
jgi:hypothetical protein